MKDRLVIIYQVVEVLKNDLLLNEKIQLRSFDDGLDDDEGDK